MTLAKNATRKGSVISNRVHIYVNGYLFETMEETLQRFPETLLGSKTKRAKYYCPYRKAYYFDRNWLSFDSLLYFYQSHGKIYRPPDIDVDEFLDDCHFFQLPGWVIRELKIREGKYVDEMIHAALLPRLPSSRDMRGRLLMFLEYPASSRWACAYFFTCMGFIMISIGLSISQQVIDDTENLRKILIFTLNFFFFAELVVRVIISTERFNLLKRVSSLFEIIALITSILFLLRSKFVVAGFNICFQTFRMPILVGRSSTLRFIFVLLQVSFEDIARLLICFGIYIVFGAGIIFNLETIQWSTSSQFTSATLQFTSSTSQFTSIPESLWWGIQTATTVGYGDIVPSTMLSKIFASFYMVIVIPTLLIPLTPIIRLFKKYIPLIILMGVFGTGISPNQKQKIKRIQRHNKSR